MRHDLTELERCVLGVIWRDGPVTAYEVAAHFAASLSPYWSGSAGAIYPLVKRLAARKLLRTRQQAWNGSRKTILSVTAAGKGALRAWLRPPLPPESGAPTFDSIRTRLFFLEALPPSERAALLADAERVTALQIEAAQQQRVRNEAAGQTFEALGDIGVLFELRARRQWLRAVRRKLATSASE